MEKRYIKIVLMWMLIIFSTSVHAQIGIIHSADGYSNVRKAANAKAAVLAKLPSYSIILIDEEMEVSDSEKDWVPIFFYKFNRGTEPSKVFPTLQSGYLHRSQFKDFESLALAKANQFNFSLQIGSFSKQGKQIKYINNEPYAIERINGYSYAGADCGIPKTEIKSGSYQITGKKSIIPMSYFWSIMHADNQYEARELDGHYFVMQQTGDGSCFNFVVWEFDSKGIQQRFVGWQY